MKGRMKMISLPKRPGANASVEVKERYLKRLAQIKAENKKREAYNKKSMELSKKIVKAVSGFKKY